MTVYHLIGENVHLTGQIPELAHYVGIENNLSYSYRSSTPRRLFARTVNWMGGRERELEAWFAPPGILLKTSGGSDFYIAPGGMAIVRVPNDVLAQNEDAPPYFLTDLDREILLGPALILSIALRGVWSLHASAAIFKDNLIVFLGESGQGKSTLAAYLATAGSPDWRLVADDILPVSANTAGVAAWPRFPQLKLPMEAQPGPSLPEQIPLNRICALTHADPDKIPELQLLPPGQSIRVLLRHTAGTRLFDPALLSEHLAFCARVAEQIPFYQLIYPHQKDTLPKVREFLESLC